MPCTTPRRGPLTTFIHARVHTHTRAHTHTHVHTHTPSCVCPSESGCRCLCGTGHRDGQGRDEGRSVLNEGRTRTGGSWGSALASTPKEGWAEVRRPGGRGCGRSGPPRDRWGRRNVTGETLRLPPTAGVNVLPVSPGTPTSERVEVRGGTLTRTGLAGLGYGC